MGLLFDIIWYVVIFLTRCFVIVFATPIILLWPRDDRTVSYGQTIRKRYTTALGAMFFDKDRK